MERGVYFDAWFPRQHCYHPSLPARRLRMIDDLTDYRATVLVWAALGGGSLSLPYLENEAFGDVDPRMRFYGFVNDSEFIAECHKRGIKVFGVVFEAQGWEFPVELNDAEDQVLALNELRGVGHRDWLGLREFSQNRYPRLWSPIEKYFPDGLVNSAGEPVTDLIAECCVRDIHQQPCHAHWVECPDREHQCFYMDRNNPVWREYLKAVIRIQIDAGVDGIQLDEAELPMGALQYGACFCRDCMQGFRDYLLEQPEGQRDPQLANEDLERFHYGEWLLARGYDFKTGRETTPLYADYHRFQRRAVKTYFAELADYARSYARSRGREVLVSGNFFNLYPTYYPLREKVDLIITEMRNTGYRQPAWYRYVAGFAGEKDVLVVENPYGGVVPELVERLDAGKGYDLFRLSLYEGAAMGASTTVPYGAWMGSRIEHAFYPPHALATEVQQFLAEHDRLYAKRSYHEIGVVFSTESMAGPIAQQDVSDNVANRSDATVHVPFRAVTEALSDAAVPYDVLIFADGVLAPDDVAVSNLLEYPLLVLPGCTYLTRRQAEAVAAYLDRGGTVVLTDGFGDNLEPALRERIVRHTGTTRAEASDIVACVGSDRRLVSVEGVAGNVHRLPDGSAAVHLVNYRYEPETDHVQPLRDLTVTVSLPGRFEQATVHRPGRDAVVSAAECEVGKHRVVLDELGVYAIVEMHHAKSR
ncbi:MAG TPA: alpha-amylase family protein [Actinopolymorphaceae bacterium]